MALREFPTEGEEFRSALADLDRRGSNFLVVGVVPSDAHDRVCRQLFGTDTATRRKLLVLMAKNDTRVAERLGSSPAEMAPGTVSVVRHTMLLRSAAAEPAPKPFTTQVESDRLSDLGRTISEEIREFSRATSTREPGWLRVGFDSLGPLFQAYETEPIFRFLHTVTHRIRNIEGLGHFHLPARANSPVVSLVAPMYDGIIEVGTRDDRFHERWHLTDEEVSSSWHPL